MSLTSRSQIYGASQPHSGRSMSLTSGRRVPQSPRQPTANAGSRTNSLSSRRMHSNGAVGGGSRTNSLTSNSSRRTAGSTVIKTTTTTTKEQDPNGRTRSITRTTIEQRGDVKIVRTTKTIITPSTDAPLDDELDPYEGFDEDPLDDELYDRHMTPLEEFEDEMEHDVIDMNNQNMRLASGAAAAALGYNKHSQQQYQQQQPLQQRQQPVQKTVSKPQHQPQSNPANPVSSPARSPVSSHRAHFKDQPELIQYESIPLDKPLSHNYHDVDTKYPSSEDVAPMEEEPIPDGDIHEPTLTDEVDGEEAIDFDELRRNRLSEIAEVTEPFDDSFKRGPTDSIVIRKPIEDSLEIDDTIDMNRQLDIEEETEGEEEYVEASEILATPPVTPPHQGKSVATNVGLGISSVDSNANSNHLYRNLLYSNNPTLTNNNNNNNNSYSNTNSLNNGSPRKNSIPVVLETTSTPVKQLKPALKSSQNSIVSSSTDTQQQPQPQHQKKKDLTPVEMYTAALKVAEKKVYGTPPNTADTANMDMETLRNTQMNSQSSSVRSSSPVIQPLSTLPAYKSNAPSKFKVKSLREDTHQPFAEKQQPQQPQPAQKSHNQIKLQKTEDVKLLKEQLERENQTETKRWEQERKQMLQRIRIDENNNFVTIPESAIESPQKKKKKGGLFGFSTKRESNGHSRTKSVASEASQASSFKEKMFNKRKQSIEYVAPQEESKPAVTPTIVQEEHIIVESPPIVPTVSKPALTPIEEQTEPVLLPTQQKKQQQKQKQKKAKGKKGFGAKLLGFFDL